jgi:AbrB family looped-hinge helix DNA binding protein
MVYVVVKFDHVRLDLAEHRTFRMYDFPMTRTTLRAKGQLTLPEAIRTAARLEEGDLLDAVMTDDGILLRPQKMIDASQAWFWTPDWQQGERAADVDAKASRVETFDSGGSLLTGLSSLAKKKSPTRRKS